jgi:hypothetical protein
MIWTENAAKFDLHPCGSEDRLVLKIMIVV